MDINFNKNEDYNKLLVSDLKKRFAKVKMGGGQKRIDKHHEKGKLTARERIDYLLDNDKKLTVIKDRMNKNVVDYINKTLCDCDYTKL